MPPYEEYIEAIKPLWQSRWLTNMGTYHNCFEEQLRIYLDVPNVSLVVNGHMALEMTIQAFSFPHGSEIITTPFTFVSTTHAIIRNGLRPVFCDVKEEDGTIDEKKIEDLISEKTVAILPVHIYGNICNVEEIKRIADNYGLKVIYDAAHAFGVKYKGHGIGCFGDASIFSFHATKVFNTIEGGAVAFKNQELYDTLYNLKNFGIRNEELVVTVGANAKMNEFCAIMGLCNLKHIAETLKKREYIFNYYCQRLEKIDCIKILIKDLPSKEWNYAYLPIIIDNKSVVTRDEVYDYLCGRGIFTRKYFFPITADHACFKNKYRKLDLKVARDLSNRILTLPIYEDMETKQVDRIIASILNII